MNCSLVSDMDQWEFHVHGFRVFRIVALDASHPYSPVNVATMRDDGYRDRSARIIDQKQYTVIADPDSPLRSIHQPATTWTSRISSQR